MRPDLAQKKDSQGCTSFIRAGMRDHLKMRRELLGLEPNLVSQRPTNMKGHVDIKNKIVFTSLPSAEWMTNHGMTLSPEGWKNRLSEGVKHSEWTRNTPGLLNMRDGDGNRVIPYVS